MLARYYCLHYCSNCLIVCLLIKTIVCFEHISNIATTASQNLYALKTLKAFGLPPSDLYAVSCATLVSRLSYASPAWRGFARVSDLDRLNGIMSRAAKWGLFGHNRPVLADILDKADSSLFRSVLSNKSHVLHPLLPPDRPVHYSLRPRVHNKLLPLNTTASAKNFLHRMLYSSLTQFPPP